MKKTVFQLLIPLMLFFGFPNPLAAQTGYVSDVLFLTFRDAPKESSNVIQRLKSDTPVSIIGEQAEYYKVELDSKDVGWVDKRFISFETPKSIIIETLKLEIKTLEQKILEFQTQIQSSRNQISGVENESVQKIKELEISLKTAMDETAKANLMLSDTQGKYDTLIEQSKNIQQIVGENKQLLEKTEFLSAELAGLKAKESGFLNGDMIKWLFGHSVSINKRRGGSSLLS